MPIIVGTELRYTSVDLEYDDTTLVNLAQIGREGGVQQSVGDAASQAAYLIHAINRTDLQMETDDEAADYAGWIVYLSKDPELRFVTLELLPQRFDTLWLAALGLEIGDRVQIARRPPGGGTITRDCYIRGIAHEATPDTWKTIFTLQSATKFDAVFILDDPAFGVLDTSVLAF